MSYGLVIINEDGGIRIDTRDYTPFFIEELSGSFPYHNSGLQGTNTHPLSYNPISANVVIIPHVTSVAGTLNITLTENSIVVTGEHVQAASTYKIAIFGGGL